MKIEKPLLGLAAEFLAASELCCRNMYAQLTLGEKKRTNILVETEEGMIRLQVKGKQSSSWPNYTGVYGDELLILVDNNGKSENERPDFYILTSEDWKATLEEVHKDRLRTGKVIIDEHNVPIWPRQIGKNGKPYNSHSIVPREVERFKEKWERIPKRIGTASTS